MVCRKRGCAGSGSTRLRRRITATSMARGSRPSLRPCEAASRRSRDTATPGLATSSASTAYSTVLSTWMRPSRSRLREAMSKRSAPMSTGAIASIGWPGATLARRSSACTRASSSRIGQGLPSTSSAPISSANTRSISSLRSVSRISGTRSPSPRSWRQACSPLWPGSAASITTTSGRCRCMRRSRSAADSMVVTVRPWASK